MTAGVSDLGFLPTNPYEITQVGRPKASDSLEGSWLGESTLEEARETLGISLLATLTYRVQVPTWRG